MPYAIDLFCGAGGCSEGLIQAGFHILFSSDISANSRTSNTHTLISLTSFKLKIVPGRSLEQKSARIRHKWMGISFKQQECRFCLFEDYHDDVLMLLTTLTAMIQAGESGKTIHSRPCFAFLMQETHHISKIVRNFAPLL